VPLSTSVPQPNCAEHTIPLSKGTKMSSSTSLEEKFEQLMKLNAKKDAQLEYLRKQLDQAMRNN